MNNYKESINLGENDSFSFVGRIRLYYLKWCAKYNVSLSNKEQQIVITVFNMLIIIRDYITFTILIPVVMQFFSLLLPQGQIFESFVDVSDESKGTVSPP